MLLPACRAHSTLASLSSQASQGPAPASSAFGDLEQQLAAAAAEVAALEARMG